MKKLTVMITLLGSCAMAQVYQPINGWCQLGGVGVAAPSTLGGVPKQQFMQASYTGCTITVFNHGTTVPAAIYSTSSGTALSNPFQANTTTGFFQAFATSGQYDVLEGGNISPPVSLGTVSLLDLSSYKPAGGSTGQVQYNCAGMLCGSPFLVYSTASTPTLTLTGDLNTGPTVVSGTLSATSLATLGGVVTLPGTAIDVATGSFQLAGGYIQIPPIVYPTNLTCLDVFGNQVSIPTPGPGMPAFGPNDLLLWNSLSPLPPAAGSPGGCPTALPPNLLYGINTNGYFFARGGYATDLPSFNAFHAFTGGMTAASYTAGGFYPPGTVTACCGTLSAYTYIGGYMSMGHSIGPPATGTVATVNNPLTQYDGINQGTFYWDDALGAARVYNGTTWVNLGGGGGGGTGNPGGARYNIQTNNPAGTFYGDQAFTYLPGSPVTTGVGVVTLQGYIQATGASGGLDVPSDPEYNSIQSASGGMYALSFTALNYAQTGSYSASLATGPTASTADSFHAGALSYSTASNCEALYNGSAWGCIGGGTPGGIRYSIQVNNPLSTLYGDSTFTFVPGSPAHMQIVGYIQATGTSGGFDATADTQYNSIQAPAGGMYSLSFTALNYVQTGNYGGTTATGPTATTSDTFQKGALSYSTTSSCEAVYTGTTWTCLLTTASGGPWTLTGGLLYPTTNSNKVLVGRSTDDTSGAIFQVLGSINSSATIQSDATAASITFQGNGGTFQVDGYGDISSGGSINATGNSTLGLAAYRLSGTTMVDATGNGFLASLTLSGLTSSAAQCIQVNTVGLISGTGVPCAGGSGIWATSGILVYPTTVTNHVIVGRSTDDGSGAQFEVGGNGQINAAGVIQSTVAAGTGAAFQVANGTGDPFIVDGYGDVSSGGSINVTGNATLGLAPLRVGGIAVISSSRQGTFQSLAATNLGSGSAGCLYSDSSGNIVGTGSPCATGWYSPIANYIAPSSTNIRVLVGSVADDGTNAWLQVYGASGNPGAGQISAGSTIRSGATGSTIAFQANSGSFQVDGYGDVSSGGSVNATGNSTLGLAPYRVNGTTIVDTSRNGFLAALTLSSTTSGGFQCLQANSSGLLSGTGAPCGTANQWTLSGFSLYPNSTGYNVLIGETSNLSGAKLEVNGSIDAYGVIQSSVTGTSIGLQVNGGNMQVNGNGVVSAASYANFIGGYRVNGTQAIDTSGNFVGPAVNVPGVVQSQVTGCGSGNPAFQTANTNFSVDGCGDLSITGAAHLYGGIVTLSGTNSVLYVGSTGNFYNRTVSSSSGISCSGVGDGWMAVTSDDYVAVCLGGTRYRAALTSY